MPFWSKLSACALVMLLSLEKKPKKTQVICEVTDGRHLTLGGAHLDFGFGDALLLLALLLRSTRSDEPAKAPRLPRETI